MVTNNTYEESLYRLTHSIYARFGVMPVCQSNDEGRYGIHFKKWDGDMLTDLKITVDNVKEAVIFLRGVETSLYFDKIVNHSG